MAKSPRTTKPAGTPAAKATRAPAAKSPKSTAPPREATPDESDDDGDAIARRAYEIYQERGGGHGADVEDWLRAEREIRSRRSDDAR